MKQAVLVADLAFGDCGKGLLVDALTRRLGATLVVRYNGGAQAGHNVVTPDGRHHTFSQLGAGTFVPGVRTLLSERVIVHPTALLAEAERLAAAGVRDGLARLTVDERALVTTPYHQAAGRLRELARGAARHGSCGVGIGETAGDALEDPCSAIRFGDLRDASALRRAARAVRERKREQTRGLWALCDDERRVLESDEALDLWVERACAAARSVSIAAPGEAAALVSRTETAVFEGAQGVLLDERFGFHPHTTWSDCTFAGALALLEEALWDARVLRLGVLRAYLVRHGAGPLPTEAAVPCAPERHNADGPWQGPVRRGWPDLALLRYALQACGGCDGLALTHADALEPARRWRFAGGYGDGDRLPLPRSTAEQEALTARLRRAEPRYEEVAAAAFVDELEKRVETPVTFVSRGPAASDVSERTGCPAPASR